MFARGLGRIHSFADISSNPVVQSLLAAQYGDVHDIDLWVGGISEDPVNGGHVGELFVNILKSQFEDVIRRDTTIDTEIDDDVFHVNRVDAGSGAISETIVG